MAGLLGNHHSLEDDPLWYLDAIIYELHVRAFADSDGDGVGDFLGLIERLDYLQDLGVTAIWLLPFYPSPLRDDGYDISDYTAIQPAYGDMRDFRLFVQEAHRRGIRVITELVLNHTSDQHPWFQRARRASPDSRWRDFYMWSDTPEKYREARIIFKDFESSNWTLDPVAKAYYWHRFYSHQPDLNYDSPHVQREVLRIVDFWMRQGVDGLRADAVPYLYAREGTNCENLPETHEFLRKLRQHVDSKFTNRMLLAEANQWPEDAIAYFGDGDEFHMAFHFPLMPRMFMALRMEDRFPVLDILQETPAIPEACQWALFLRNHDELTLEMVTDEERDYMYRVYAHDPSARINLGIRRRLAPLLGNDRRKIELMNGLLFSLPGTPVIYYGDEIGMGDNFYLGDRNGVRTPMQWSLDRNAGFSRANPQQLYLPAIIDPEYHYEAVNAETQQNNPHSLLWWMKRTVALRKRFRAFGRGTIRLLYPDNRHVLAFIRQYEEERILVLANLSHAVQHVHLDLAEFQGCALRELFGGVEFAPVGDFPYYLTLGAYSFYWLSIEQKPAEPAGPGAGVEEPRWRLASITSTQQVSEVFRRKENWRLLEKPLQSYMKEQRWFRGKARRLQSVSVADIVPVQVGEASAHFVFVSVHYGEGEDETYAVPLAVAPIEQAESIAAEFPQAVVAVLRPRKSGAFPEMALYDALVDKDFCRALLVAIGRRRRFKGYSGTISASPTRTFRKICWPPELPLEPSPLGAEQSNSSLLYEDRLILKLFRRLEEGTNPELELGRFLTEEAEFPHIPPMAGMMEYHPTNGTPSSLAVLQGFVRSEGDAWQYTLSELDLYFNSVLAHPTVQIPPMPQRHLLLLDEDATTLAQETIGPYLSSAHLLGERTGQLHIALASGLENRDFAPEPFTITYQNSIYHGMRRSAIAALQLLRDSLRGLPEDTQAIASRVLDQQNAIIERYKLLRGGRIEASRIRCHGDYHLGQVLYTGKDFVIIDFEGEPARPLGERRIKWCPLRDVAGMIRSFHYASHMALPSHSLAALRPEDAPALELWGQFWYTWVSAAFLSSYMGVIQATGLVPDNVQDLRILLDAYLLEKAIYEVGYELNNRPDWVLIPLKGIAHLLEVAE
jgi:maltose alpha-D-glucosyltransferase/alpha-amylase